MNNKYLFVYGTLMHNSEHPMHQVLQAHSEFVCHGRIRAQLYQIHDYPGAVLSNMADDEVHGEVYRLATPSVLAQLDDFEECSAAFPEPREYRRQTVEVTVSGGKSISAWAYIYNHPVDPNKRIVNGRFQLKSWQ
ncbi:gamma-glutamylcyclotransferase family protein [Methylophaga sp. OBS1]|uniref:gamma-glutamylcyclotransferase family protein n=1 Tax=Methylophaga sp. OBS1 TaxID=2991933 RepID=UPI0022580647|nr:gamma-glutamylcyclotransferase family protein [Methylophaga sp. OBS1]MCX4191471.1 gamma-glutamylcyclotransferase [Methylophaga sp. OBS1]MCX4191584.1 gamma-glutamylcyclotransferase [Methylophaga sp. OBS1]